jgi:hypothetical protein
MFEIEMANKCYGYLCQKTDTYTDIVREVPFLSRCIDLVLLTKKNEAITIEFKIKNWRQAIEQVKNHMLGADKVYICLPERNPSDLLINALLSEKIGLFLYNPNTSLVMSEYLSAPKNERKVKLFNNMLLSNINTILKNPETNAPQPSIT